MSDRCDSCVHLDSIRCRECMEGGFCFYEPLVVLRPPNQELRRPYTPPTAEVVPITNEMHLRTMSREEWVEILYSLYLHSADFDCGEISLLWCDGKDNRYDEDGEILCNEERHKACILRWLQSPYKPKEAVDA